MARDPELQKLVDEAEKQRKVDARAAIDREVEERMEAREAKKKPAVKPTRRLGVFVRVTRSGIGFFWWVGLVTALISAPFAKQFWYLPVAMGVAFLVRVAFFVRRIRRDYPAFVRFPEGLRIKVDGGNDLIDNKLVDDSEDWQRVAAVRVTLGAEADQAVVDAVLDLFVTKANGRFYGPGGPIGGAATDPREKWKRTGHEVSGSINLWVIADVYALIHTLDALHAKIGGIERVSFTSSGGIYDIPAPSAD